MRRLCLLLVFFTFSIPRASAQGSLPELKWRAFEVGEVITVETRQRFRYDVLRRDRGESVKSMSHYEDRSTTEVRVLSVSKGLPDIVAGTLLSSSTRVINADGSFGAEEKNSENIGRRALLFIRGETAQMLSFQGLVLRGKDAEDFGEIGAFIGERLRVSYEALKDVRTRDQKVALPRELLKKAFHNSDELPELAYALIPRKSKDLEGRAALVVDWESRMLDTRLENFVSRSASTGTDWLDPESSRLLKHTEESTHDYKGRRAPLPGYALHVKGLMKGKELKVYRYTRRDVSEETKAAQGLIAAYLKRRRVRLASRPLQVGDKARFDHEEEQEVTVKPGAGMERRGKVRLDAEALLTVLERDHCGVKKARLEVEKLKQKALAPVPLSAVPLNLHRKTIIADLGERYQAVIGDQELAEPLLAELVAANLHPIGDLVPRPWTFLTTEIAIGDVLETPESFFSTLLAFSGVNPTVGTLELLGEETINGVDCALFSFALTEEFSEGSLTVDTDLGGKVWIGLSDGLVRQLRGGGVVSRRDKTRGMSQTSSLQYAYKRSYSRAKK